MTCGRGAKETAHKCVSVKKQKSINSFNPVNYYVVRHNIFSRPNCSTLSLKRQKFYVIDFLDIQFFDGILDLLINILVSYGTIC